MPAIEHKYKKLIIFSSISVMVLGLITAVQIYLINFTAVGGNFIMAIDTAICLILVSIALLFKICGSKKKHSTISRLICFLVFILGIIALAEDFTTLPMPVAFGMSPQTALCLICLSTAFYYIDSKKRKHVVQWLLHLVTIMACVIIIGHTLRIPEFYSLSFIPMTIYAAFAFLFISVTASFLNPSIGATGLFTGRLIGNLMARRLFFSLFAAIIITVYIRIALHRRGLIGVELGAALSAVTFCTISLVLIWVVSQILNKAQIKVNMARDNLHIMVQAAPYALIISDKNGIILEINDKTQLMFGYPDGELLGKSVATLIPESIREAWMTRRMAFLSDPATSVFGLDDEIIALKKNGKVFPIEIVLTPIYTDGDVRILSFVVDITTRKANEETIRTQVTELQHKNEELEQFNYISSHDLQEPLRTVSNYINLLEEDYPEQIHGEVKEHLQSIDNAVSRMLKLVRSLLEFGKLGQGRKMSLIDSQTLINDVLADLKGLITANNATVLVEGELPKLYAYETELRQLFQNLINNAVKFKKEDTPPHIAISCKSIDGYYRFSVADNGIGIAPQHTVKIFNIFQRLNKPEAYEGYGIGLANCKKIAELHGGKIWVESEPGTGSTFKFTVIKLKK